MKLTLIQAKRNNTDKIPIQRAKPSHNILFKSTCHQNNTRCKRHNKESWSCYDLPLLIQMFLRNLVGMLTRKLSPWAVTASCRLLPRLAMTCEGTSRGGQSQDNAMQLASWSMRGGFEPLCYLHNLLVLCGRDKVSEDLLDNVLAFCCLWHHKRWSWITSASWGQHGDVHSNTVTVTYWLTWFFKLNLRYTDKIVKWL